MKLNADFSQRVAVHFDETEWVPSPAAGVHRKMLDRIGDEVARATTIVRFAPGSAFDAHTHGGGEEYLVLGGVFQDETGDFPVGHYVRNPPTSSHTPATVAGATILVKLHQFDPADRTGVHIDTSTRTDDVISLFSDPGETVRIENWGPAVEIERDAQGGIEVFVIDGEFSQDGERFGRWDWLRLPVGSVFQATAGPQGARAWIKSGHLKNRI